MITKLMMAGGPARMLRCMMLPAIMLISGCVVEGEEYPDEEPIQLDESTVQDLNEAVGGRSVNFVLNFVEEGGAIVPAGAEQKLVRSTHAPNFAETPPRVILFFDNNDTVCIQKPSGEWECYSSS